MPPPGAPGGGPPQSIAPKDPNDIVGPDGYGAENYVAADQRLSYRIRFENDSTQATAPAQRIEIRQSLDDDLNLQSFRLSRFGFANQTFNVPGGQSSYQTRLDLRDSLDVFVDVTAGVDVLNDEVFWIFQSIDPATGQVPTNPLVGMLPVNDTTGVGEGFVDYTVRSDSPASTGTEIGAEATITFDTEGAIETPPITNTIDAGAPTSQVDSVASTPGSEEMTIYLSGSDAETGIASYDVFVSEDSGPFREARRSVTDTTTTYRGSVGSNYDFYARATDNAGNREAAKSSAEASDFLGQGLEVFPGDANDDGTVNQNDVIPIGTFYGQSGPPRTLGGGFNPTAIVPWTTQSATFADANGDGTINQNDVIPIGTFYGQTQPTARGPDGESEPYATIQIRPLPKGTTVPVYVRVGDEGDRRREVLGWAAGVQLPTETLTLESAEPTSILGDDPIALKRHDEENGILAMGYTRRAPDGTVALANDKVMKLTLKVTGSMQEHARIQLREATVSGLSNRTEAAEDDSPVRLTSPYAEDIPASFTLKQNYPNPASQRTTIRFSVPEPSTVSLEVYDLLGRRVATLKRDDDVKAGWHSVRVNASRLASGTYFYRLRADDELETKKLVVVH